ncbi:probable glutathione S-transferase parC [Mercurialis annua]|uniref:probable glutathione S-transferase parC n=1 Tax=Mercurialis annua TaxID=3986 RepID=UPI00215FD431|nr:probable glutathione S-transferase parC [Mercurialis annua]
MSKAEIVVLDFWASPFCMRVKIALNEKGVSYEAKEEDLFGGKSELLLKSNPVYQKVPVFLHDEKPLSESTVIVGYIDETWPTPALLPPSPYARAQARFWADYVDKKVFDALGKIWRNKAEAAEAGKIELIEIVKVLEGALGDADFFGGETFGYVDLITIPLTSWFLAVEKLANFSVEIECPKFGAWIKRCLKRESVSKIIPDPEKVYEFVVMARKMYGID